MRINKLTDIFSVSPQIQYGDFKVLAKQGFTTVINNRPDGEDAAQPLSKALAKAAKQAGIAYHHIPVKPGRAGAEDRALFKQALEDSNGPVLAFCRSGMRARSLHKACTAASGGGFFGRLFGRS